MSDIKTFHNVSRKSVTTGLSSLMHAVISISAASSCDKSVYAYI